MKVINYKFYYYSRAGHIKRFDNNLTHTHTDNTKITLLYLNKSDIFDQNITEKEQQQE